MKFFVETRGGTSARNYTNLEEVRAKQALLKNLKEQGILDHAYIKIAGGAYYIVNADSFADVRTAFRESKVSMDYECEIREIKTTFE